MLFVWMIIIKLNEYACEVINVNVIWIRHLPQTHSSTRCSGKRRQKLARASFTVLRLRITYYIVAKHNRTLVYDTVYELGNNITLLARNVAILSWPSDSDL